jgi:flagellar assembly protein FliH
LRQRKVFTQEQLDSMLTRARHDGMKMGQVRAAEATVTVIQQLCSVVREAANSTRGQIEDVRREAASLAFVAAKKLAGEAVAALPEADVEAALREAIHQAISEPRIVLRAAPNVVAALKDKLDELAHETGYEGRIVASPELGMKGGDCRIEWRGGGAERSMDQLEEAIGEVVVRRFSQNDTRKG